MAEAPTVSETFGRRLVELRGARGWSQRELVAELERVGFSGLDRTAVARIEGAGRKVSIEELVAIAVALGVSPFALLLPRSGDLQLTETQVESVEVVAMWLRNAQPLPEVEDPDVAPSDLAARRAERGRAFWSAVPDTELAFTHEHEELHLVGLNVRAATMHAQQGNTNETLAQLETVRLSLDVAIAAERAKAATQEGDD
jgi:transcriptional regulator with XRE-family HTH domain